MPDVTPIAAIPFPLPADNVGAYPDPNAEAMAMRIDELLPRVIVKPTSETVTSSTVLQNDDALFFSVDANAEYILTAVLVWEASIASGIVIEWGAPAGTTFTGASLINDSMNDSIAVTSQLTRHLSWTLDPAASHDGKGAGIGLPLSFVEHLKIKTDAASGTIQLKWAQSISHATNTRLKLDSYLVVQRVA